MGLCLSSVVACKSVRDSSKKDSSVLVSDRDVIILTFFSALVCIEVISATMAHESREENFCTGSAAFNLPASWQCSTDWYGVCQASIIPATYLAITYPPS